MGHKYRYRPGQMVPGTGLKVVRPLGSGGMGAVYEVEETSVEAPFVMKVVHPHLLLPGSNAAERMRQEAKTQARLNHRNIVRVYRAGVTAESPPLPYYVMDRLSGYSLRQALRWHTSKGAFIPLGWAFWIGASVLQALEHAHKNGVVHRDVKPDNIFIHHVEGQKPVTKLLDFGIVAALSELSDKTRLTGGGFAGTYTHAAPEQLQGAKPAPTMDIYSAGMVLFEMLTGRRPFDDRKTPEDIIYAQLHTPPPPISRGGVHPKLATLVAQMLAKDPARRPQTAQDALRSLSQIKTEWIQQSTDVSTGDSMDFQFDVDLGERWPTNFEADGDFDVGSDASEPKRDRPSRKPGSAALLGTPELANVEPVDLAVPSEPESKSVPTRSTWWSTVDRYKLRLRVSHVLLTAAGFAGLTAGATWFWIGARSSPTPPAATSSSPVTEAPDPADASPTSSLPVAPPLEPPPGPAEPPVSPPAVPSSGAASSRAEHPAPIASAPRALPPATKGRDLTKHAPALAKPGGARQSPPSEPAPTDRPQSSTGYDPMKP